MTEPGSPPGTPPHTAGPRDTLLAKAVDYYAEHGVRDTSLRTLAAAIGTSQRMLHYHFGSREDVLAAVIEAVAQQQIATLTELFATEPDPFVAGRRNWANVAGTASRFAPLYFELSSHAMHGRPYAQTLGDVLTRRWREAFAAAFAPHTDPERADAFARLSLAVGRGLLFDLAIEGDRAAAERAVAQFEAMVRAELARA